MITTTLDNNNALCNANDINAPQKGKCPICSAPMYRTTKHKGIGPYYYALMHGHEHKYEQCPSADELTIYDSKKLDPDKMLASLAALQKRNGQAPKTDPDITRLRAFSPIDQRFVTPYAIRHLHMMGLLDTNNIPLANGKWLSDLTINPYFSYMLLGTWNIGPRILQGRPQTYNDSAKIIRLKVFVANNVDGKSINQFFVTDLHFHDSITYATQKQRLFKPSSPAQKLTHIYDNVAVFGVWHRATVEECRHYCKWQCCSDGWSCAGYLYTDISQDSHIYPMRPTPVKSENPHKSKG